MSISYIIFLWQGGIMDDTKLKQYFGARIKEIRESRGLNQEQLAELVNMESRHISRIETGKSFTTLENISKIAIALGVSIDSLFSFQHKVERENLKEEIKKYLNHADKNKLELVLKLLKAVFD